MKTLIAVLAVLLMGSASFAQVKKAKAPEAKQITTEFVRAAIAALNALEAMDGSAAAEKRADDALDAAKTIEESEPDDDIRAIEGHYNFRLGMMRMFHGPAAGMPELADNSLNKKYQACVFPLKEALRKRQSEIPTACVWDGK